jgi:hypothetical protein
MITTDGFKPLAVKMAPPQRMLAALKELGIGTP